MAAQTKFSNELKHLENAWEHFNAEFFDGRLKKPKFQVFAHNRFAGEWVPRKKTMFKFTPPFHDGAGTFKVASYLFENEENLKTVILHEMCHQAVSTFHHRDEVDENGFHFPHGPKWRKWAEKCGVADIVYETSEQQSKQGHYGVLLRDPKSGDYVFGEFVWVRDFNETTLRNIALQGTCYVTDVQNGYVYVLFVEQNTNNVCMSTLCQDSVLTQPEKAEIPYLKQRIENFLSDEKNKKVIKRIINIGAEKNNPLVFADFANKRCCCIDVRIKSSQGPRM